MHWLDPEEVPTLGDWFRAGGYRTHYRGKWHISHADLSIPGTHEGIKASDDEGSPIPDAVDAYRKADRLDPFGFSGWIGREPHGADKSDCGTIRDGVFAEQVVELFDELAASRDEGPWLTVASFVNPHDIAFSGFGWDQILQFGPPDDTVPSSIPEAPSQGDTFAGRPSCQESFKDLWPQMIFPTATDLGYRRLYYYLHKLVDQAIGRILDALDRSGQADDTIIVFTSDHGEMLGERGMWFKMSMYEWSVRVPMIVSWPGRLAPGRVARNVSLVDLLPTLLALGNTGAAQPVQAVEPLAGNSLLPLIAAPNTPDWPDRVISDFTAGGVPGPLRMFKQGSLKLILTGGHRPMLFDLAADPDELNDLAGDPGAAQSLAGMMELASREYDPARIDAAVRESQKRRLLIREVESLSGSAEPWNWKVYPNDDQRYVRGGGLQHGEHATKARARFPHVPEAD